jgi:hypothetical protein
MVSFAKVLTLHLPSEKVDALLDIFDVDLAPRYVGHPGFRGLLCLELGADTSRSQIYVVSLWDEAMVEDSDDPADRWWDDASEVLGIGIARHTAQVLREIPGITAD